MGFRKKTQQLSEQGQNLVELALILPLMFIILIGVLDLGRIFFAEIAVANAAREGVRYLTTHPTDEIGGFVNTKKAATIQGSFSGLESERFTVAAFCTYYNKDGCVTGRKLNQKDNKAVVTVTYGFSPIIGWVLPETITLSETATMVVP